jgi:hypothetical protein
MEARLIVSRWWSRIVEMGALGVPVWKQCQQGIVVLACT